MTPTNGFAIAALFGVLLAFDSVQAAERAIQPDKLARLVAELGDDQFARREAASAALAKAGLPAVKVLSRAVASENAEIAWRACAALEQIGIHGDEQALAAVADALSQASGKSRPGLATMVAEMRARHGKLRRNRAVEQVRALGGDVGVASVSAPIYESSITVLAAPVAFGFEVVTTEIVEADGLEVGGERRPEREPADDAAEASEVDAAADEVPAAPAPDAEAIVEFAPDPGSDLPEPAPPPDELPAEPDLADEDVIVEIGAGESEGEISIVDFAGPVATDTAGGAEDFSVTTLTLTKKWRGGDRSLALLGEIPELQQLEIEDAALTDAAIEHLKRLPNLSYLKIKSTPITSQALRDLHQARPGLMITAVGEAMLGVSAEVAGDRCQVTSVFGDSGAFDAGLQAGDQITKVDDAKIVTFVDLMIAVYGRKAGEKLELQFERSGTLQTAMVELKPRSVVALADK